jgi:uroporphyrinogen decarboxylase
MNGRQRIAAALRGEPPDRVPVMLHNFMMAARQAGYTMGDYRRSPEAIAKSFIQAVETYGYDGVVVDVDTATLAGAVGVPVELPEDGPASFHGAAIAGLEQVRDLPPPDVSRNQRIQIWLEAARRLQQYFGAEIAIRGNCDQAPFSLAASMRSIAEFLMDVMNPDNDPLVHALVEYCTCATTQFIALMAKTGVPIVSNGNSTAGPDMASPAIYRRLARGYDQRVAEFTHAMGLPWLLHICGKTDRILEDMVSTGADGLELDYKTDLKLARDTLAGRTCFIGNLDPSAVLAQGTPDLVAAKTHELIETFAGNPRFILNAGCAIPGSTPAENIHAMMRAARESA